MREFVKGQFSSILVAALSTAFGVTLLQTNAALFLMIESNPAARGSQTVGVFLDIAAYIFIAIALYVGAIVTTNTFSTIVAGRTRTIALFRLIGSSAAAQRRSVAREGLIVGVCGSVVGVAAGTAATWALVSIGTATKTIPALAYSYFDPILLLPVAAVILTTVLASWIGSRRVLDVTPIHALGSAQELSLRQADSRRGRNATAITLFSLGLGLILLGIVVGLISPLGVLIGLVGGIFSFSGVMLGAHLVMPRALRLVGHLFGKGAAATLASENAVR